MSEVVYSTKDADRMVKFTIDVLRKNKKRAHDYAVVFDIDETLLKEHPDDETKWAANRPVVKVYDEANRLGYKIYLVTARRKSAWGIDYARKQLRKLGLTKHETVYMLNKTYADDKSASRFKRDARKRIADKHERGVLLNVGDQWSDQCLVEPFATNPFKDLDTNTFHVILNPDAYTHMGVKLKQTYVVD